jgi:hypothetical protein
MIIMADQTRRQQIIEALRCRNIKALKQLKETDDIVYITKFLDCLKASSCPELEDKKFVFLPGPFMDFIENNIEENYSSNSTIQVSLN